MEIVRDKKEVEHFSDLKSGDVFSFVEDRGMCLSPKDIFMVVNKYYSAVNLRTGDFIDDDIFDADDKVVSYPNAKLYLNN